MEWSRLEGEALAKFQQVFTQTGATIVFASEKIRNKTIFARDHGVVTFYVAGDDGHAYSLKECMSAAGISAMEPIILEELVRAASGLEYNRKIGIYRNFKLGVAP